MPAYYNENDPFAAQWLRNLIAAGHIANGDVDERSIAEVTKKDLEGYVQHHFFAGIGGWSLALRLSGWPDGRPVWTGSCPCQPFSDAGQKKGFDDARHLWPEWFRLVRDCRPGVVFGEQVASKAVLPWLDLVQSEMEAEGYAFGAVDLCAAGVGAPHIRQRLYFVAYSDGRDPRPKRIQRSWEHGQQSENGGPCEGMADVKGSGLREGHAELQGDQWEAEPSSDETCGLGNSKEFRQKKGDVPEKKRLPESRIAQSSFWGDAEWLPCTDGKARPIEPGTFPLANGIPGRVGRLRAYGNAIVPQVAAEFIKTFLER